jgi:uncharacterized protein (TIGR02285 family)
MHAMTIDGLKRAGLGLLLGVSLLGLAHRPARAAEPPTIEWYMIDLPPIQILNGALRGKGYTDRIRWRLIAELPGYRHVLRIANVQRILADIKTKPNVCNPAFMRTPEREQFMIFSDALHAQFPNGAVVLKSRQDEFQRFIRPDGTLAVDALIEAGNGTLAVQSGRSYGVVLDGLAEKARRNNRLVTLTSSHPVESKLELVKKGRVEAALLYPFELAVHLSTNASELALYEFLPVEGNGTYTLNYLACSKSPLGEKIIAEANPIIAAERDGFFSATYREWLPESILKLHAAHHQSAFRAPLRNAAQKADTLDESIAACLLEGGTWYRQGCEKPPARPGE